MLMDRAIFELNASVEATSLYILICALLEQGEAPSLNRAMVQWNGTMDTLVKATEELIVRGVLEGPVPGSQEQPLQVNSKDKWR